MLARIPEVLLLFGDRLLLDRLVAKIRHASQFRHTKDRLNSLEEGFLPDHPWGGLTYVCLVVRGTKKKGPSPGIMVDIEKFIGRDHCPVSQ